METFEYSDPDDGDADDFDLGPVGGVCRSCGCTDDAACPGGCVWATPDADLCSRCARNESA